VNQTNDPRSNKTPKRAFQVTDIKALGDAYPQLLKSVPDYAKIRKALSIGLELPGVERIDTPIEAIAKGKINF
jgi:hypothetical protein